MCERVQPAARLRRRLCSMPGHVFFDPVVLAQDVGPLRACAAFGAALGAAQRPGRSGELSADKLVAGGQGTKGFGDARRVEAGELVFKACEGL